VTLPVADVADALLDPWRSGISGRALVEVALLGVAAGPLGCWVVLYGLSYSAESLGHALFPGLVIAALAGFPLVLGAVLGAVVAAPAIAYASRVGALGGDTAVAVVVTTLVGAGALLALSPDTPAAVQELLFGDVLAVTGEDLALAAALAAAVLVALRLGHGRLLIVGFDRSNARAFGSDPAAVDLVLLLLVGAFTVVAVQALGSLLVLAILVGPAATASLLSRRVVPMMSLAALLALLGGAAGLYLSFYADTAGGASIAAAVTVTYACAALAQRTYSLSSGTPGTAGGGGRPDFARRPGG
jgi:ABC-type Mn2+/Zn2+ transport system permease subunit